MAEHLNQAPTTPDRIVVIGANGFVGSEIVAAAQKRGLTVLALGRPELNLLSDNGATTLAGSLQPNDSVVFVSAKAPCKDYVMFLENIILAKTALDGLKGKQLAHFLYISSDAVYSDSNTPLVEDSITAPDNLHGQMHVAREIMFQSSLGETPFATLRPTLIYGARDPHNGYGPNRFRRLVKKGEPIELFGKGEERRDHVSVRDVAELAMLMCEHKTVGAVNAVTGDVASFMDLAQMTVGWGAKPVPIKSLPRSSPMPHGGYRPFDSSGVLALFPTFRFTTIEDGLRDAFQEDRG
jgi:nucleoside-diphosphate-sugar epimerase